MAKKNPRKVTEEELKIMIDMYQSGNKISYIAKELDRYPDVVRHNLEKAGVYHNDINYLRF